MDLHLPLSQRFAPRPHSGGQSGPSPWFEAAPVDPFAQGLAGAVWTLAAVCCAALCVAGALAALGDPRPNTADGLAPRWVAPLAFGVGALLAGLLAWLTAQGANLIRYQVSSGHLVARLPWRVRRVKLAGLRFADQREPLALRVLPSPLPHLLVGAFVRPDRTGPVLRAWATCRNGGLILMIPEEYLVVSPADAAAMRTALVAGGAVAYSTPPTPPAAGLDRNPPR